VFLQLLDRDTGRREEVFCDLFIGVPREMFRVTHLTAQFGPDQQMGLALIKGFDHFLAQHDIGLSVRYAVRKTAYAGLFQEGTGRQNVVGELSCFGHVGDLC